MVAAMEDKTQRMQRQKRVGMAPHFGFGIMERRRHVKVPLKTVVLLEVIMRAEPKKTA